MTKMKLREVDIFKGLSDLELEKILNISTIKNLSKHNVLFYEGEMPEYFYVLLEGHVKFYKIDSKGNELVLNFFTKPLLMAELLFVPLLLQ